MSLISGNELSEDTKNVSEKLSLFMKQPGVSEVLEWIFMYDKQSIFDETPYNTTFFDVIGGISYQEWKEQKITSEQLILDVNSKFTAWIRELEEIRSNLSIEGITSEKTILDGEGIDFIIVWIQTAKSATIIELEKSSKTPILTSYERQRFCSEVESGQEKLYGSKISENMEESMMSLDLLCREFSENGENLTQEQQKRFLEIYDNLKKKVEEHWEGANFEALDILRFQKKPILQHNFTKEALEKIKNIKIPRDIYMRLWQGYIDAMGLHQKVVSNPNASSIYDGPSTLEVPDLSWYDNISLKRVLELMVHEIWAHYVNQAISEQNGFSIRWAKNIEKEEGLAIVLEHLLEGKNLIDIKWPGYSFPYILQNQYCPTESMKKNSKK